MHHTIHVILLSGFFAATCTAQEQFPAASADPFSGVEPAPPQAANTEEPAAAPTARSQSRDQPRSAMDSDRNGILDQEEIDQTPSFVRDLFESRGVKLKAGMTVDEMRAAFNAGREVPPKSQPAPAGVIKVFALKYTEASSTARLLADLITTQPFRAVADDRTNSVIATGTSDQLLAVEALLMRLDEAPGVPIAKPKQDDEPIVADDAAREIQQQVAQLRKEYQTTDKLAHELAESLRKTPNKATKAELRTAVQRSFTLRQSLLRAELLEMQTRLLQTQQSIDMRERIADQIVDRRVEDLLNPQLEWDGLSSSEIAGPAANSQQANNPPAPSGRGLPEKISPEAWGQAQNGLRLAIVVKSELEGEWHLVSSTAADGKMREVRPSNITICGDQHTWQFSTKQIVRRMKIDPEKKEIWYFKEGEDDIFTRDTYVLDGDRLTLTSSPQHVTVLERGHVRIPAAVPEVTEAQRLLWRSGIVEILQRSNDEATTTETRTTGHGGVVSPKGLILSQLSPSEVKGSFLAKFDDGSVISLNIVEAGREWIVFEPKSPINLNHYFQFSKTPLELYDEVNIWDIGPGPWANNPLAPAKCSVSVLDRKFTASKVTVWQLDYRRSPMKNVPVMDAAGDLLGITISGTQGLTLAIPVEQLKLLFPKSLGNAAALPKIDAVISP